MKRKFAIGVVFSGLFLYLAARGIVWSDFASAFSDINYWYLIPGALFTMLGHYSRAYRWKSIMMPVRRIAVGPLWSATAIAFMVNNLFPARVGEFVRAVAIGRTEGVSKSAAFATIVYERVVDVFVLIVLLWYCLLKIEGPDWLPRSAAILILFNVALMAILVAMVRYRQRFDAICARLLSLLPVRIRERARYSADAFVDGLGVLTNMRAVVPILVYSIAVWGCAVLGVYYSVLALHLHVPILASIFLIVLISLGSMIPSAPAFIGTMQYACVIGLAVYGVEKSEALAYSTVYHATQFFPITLAGFYYAWRSHFRLSEISRPNE